MGVINMVVRGPASKAVKHGRTPNADWTDVPDTPYTGPSPELPRLANRRKWNELVEQWWAQVRVMPHCVMWTPTDWQFAVETALMKDQFWKDYAAGEMKGTAATEIRRREAQIGTTNEARRQLRIRYISVGDLDDDVEDDLEVTVSDEAETGSSVATVTPIGDRRARLTARSA